MFFAPRSPILRLALATWYAAAAFSGQGLHLLACHDHDAEAHTAAAHAAAADPRSESCDESLCRTVEKADAEQHDADHCPICQYHAQGQLYQPAEAITLWVGVTSTRFREAESFWHRWLDRPFGPRGPPPSHDILSS